MAAIIRPTALRVVLPVLPGADSAFVIPIASDIAGAGGQVVLLAIVPPLRGQDLSSATTTARTARRGLRSLARLVPEGRGHEQLVRAASSWLEGIREVVSEGADLLAVPLPAVGAAIALAGTPYHELIEVPPCDTLFARGGQHAELRSILVSARGGPQAELALDLAQRIGRARGATLTVLHVDVSNTTATERRQEQHLFQTLVAQSADATRLRVSTVPADSAAATVLAEAGRHDLLVLGARLDAGRPVSELGEVPAAALRDGSAPVLIVKSTRPVNPNLFHPRPLSIEDSVNSWFVANTSHCRDYADIAELVAAKRQRNLRIGVALLGGLGSDTLTAHAHVLLRELSGTAGLIDEVTLFAAPDAQMQAAAAAAGLTLHEVPDATPEQRGRLMRASIEVLSSEIVVWIDADLRNPHAKLVYGLVGPLLQDDRVQYVKGFFGPSAEAPDGDLAHLVGEFAARPLLNLFYAELSGVIDPLSGEQAIRRSAALDLPLFTGSAAPLALLVDAFELHGLQAIAQVALDERIARPLSGLAASRQAFSAVQVLTNRLGLLSTRVGASPTIKLIQQADDHFQISVIDARETELRP